MKVNIGKYKEDRKIEVKIHGYDVWNLDHTLALVIYPALLKLKEQKHGSPQVDNEDVPEEIHGVIDDMMNDDKVHEKWTWVIDEMIFAFGYIASTDNPHIKDKVIEERVENGLRLFGKYYRSLWD